MGEIPLTAIGIQHSADLLPHLLGLHGADDLHLPRKLERVRLGLSGFEHRLYSFALRYLRVLFDTHKTKIPSPDLKEPPSGPLLALAAYEGRGWGHSLGHFRLVRYLLHPLII